MPRGDNSEAERRHERERKWLEELLSEVQGQEWYGKMTITVKKGFVDAVLKEESLKPPIKPS